MWRLYYGMQQTLRTMGVEEQPLIEYRSLPTRWLALLLSGGCFLVNCFLWMYYSTIARSVRAIFNWEPHTIAMFGNYTMIVSVVFAMPGGLFLDKLGIRKCAILIYSCNFLAIFIRCFPAPSEVATAWAHVSAFMVAIPAIWTTSLPSLVALTWFPDNERMLATNVGICMNQGGAIAAFLAGPNSVNEPGPEEVISEIEDGVTVETVPRDVGAEIEVIRSQFYQYTWASAAVIGTLLLLVIIFLRDKPKSPPSASALKNFIDTSDMFGSSRLLMKSKTFWKMNLVMAMDYGSFVEFLYLMDIILEKLQVSQQKVGIIGIINCVVAIVGSTALGGLAGSKARPRTIIGFGHVIALVGAFWLLANYTGAIPMSDWTNGFATILYGMGSAPTLGITQELTVSLLHPIHEVAITTCMTMSFSICAAVLFGFASIPNIPISWIFWMSFLRCVISEALLCTVDTEYPCGVLEQKPPMEGITILENEDDGTSISGRSEHGYNSEYDNN